MGRTARRAGAWREGLVCAAANAGAVRDSWGGPGVRAGELAGPAGEPRPAGVTQALGLVRGARAPFWGWGAPLADTPTGRGPREREVGFRVCAAGGAHPPLRGGAWARLSAQAQVHQKMGRVSESLGPARQMTRRAVGMNEAISGRVGGAGRGTESQGGRAEGAEGLGVGLGLPGGGVSGRAGQARCWGEMPFLSCRPP